MLCLAKLTVSSIRFSRVSGRLAFWIHSKIPSLVNFGNVLKFFRPALVFLNAASISSGIRIWSTSLSASHVPEFFFPIQPCLARLFPSAQVRSTLPLYFVNSAPGIFRITHREKMVIDVVISFVWFSIYPAEAKSLIHGFRIIYAGCSRIFPVDNPPNTFSHGVILSKPIAPSFFNFGIKCFYNILCFHTRNLFWIVFVKCHNRFYTNQKILNAVVFVWRMERIGI